MTKQKPSCFISYCHSDVDVATLEQLEALLKDVSENNIDFIRDTQNPAGANWDDFMAIVSRADAAIVLLTPEYKKRVSTRAGGVYEEFRRIHLRLCQEREARTAEDALTPESAPKKSFSLIPIIFSGNARDSVPPEIEKENYVDLVHFHVAYDTKSNRIILADSTRNRFLPPIKRIISAIDAAIIENIPDFQFTKEKYFDQLLVNTKDEYLLRNLSETKRNYIFVKTRSYEEINRHKAFIIVGRKGSGKSTITRYIADQERDRYKSRIHFVVDDVNLDTLFTLEAFSLEKYMSDTKTIIQHADFMKAVWRLFIYYACCSVIYIENENEKLPADQVNRATRIIHLIRKLDKDLKFIGKNDFNHWTLFIYCFEVALNYLDAAVQNASNSRDKFLASLTSSANAQKIFEHCFPKAGHTAFEGMVQHCKRKFMFSFDGFDTRYEQFRADTLQLHNKELVEFRLGFERDWLRSLLHLAEDIRNNKPRGRLNDMIDFFLTIPRDRFHEIKDIERDAYIFRSRYSFIGWSAIELIIMLRKRLEIITEFRTDKVRDELERFHNFMAEQYPDFPREIEIIHDGRSYKFETILYIIRHTFWRPRDVLYYMAELLARLEVCRKRKRAFSAEIIKACISNTTYEIIKTEFVGELRSICPNIEGVIRAFENSKQVLTFSEISRVLTNVNIGFAYFTDKYETVVEKIKFLYSVGFIGFGLSDKARREFRMDTSEVFSFSEGERITEIANVSEYQKFHYIIHPVFCEFLRLDTTENELVLRYESEYLKHNDLQERQ